MTFARLSNVVAVAFLATLMLLPGTPAESQLNRPWVVWLNTAQCSMTRQSWLAVSQDSPSLNSAPGWLEAPGYTVTMSKPNAEAQLDFLRVASEWFRNAPYCCQVQVWSNASTGAFSIVEVGATPGGGFTNPSVPMCCEDAVGIAGFDPFSCTSVALVSVPGAVITVGPNGPRAQGATPVTIPTTPPVTFSPATGGQLTLEPNSNRPGLDFRNFELTQAAPEQCRDACAAENACVAYTYVKPGVQGPKARCWLKSAVPAPVAHDCCVSGVRQ